MIVFYHCPDCRKDCDVPHTLESGVELCPHCNADLLTEMHECEDCHGDGGPDGIGGFCDSCGGKGFYEH